MLAAIRRASSQILPVLSSFPSLFRLQRWTELNHSSAGGRRGSGGLATQEGMRALIARWVALIAMLRFARARYSYQSHTMRALRAVAYLTNALQVRSLVAGEEACRREVSGLILEIDLGERPPVGAADDETLPIQLGVGGVDGPGGGKRRGDIAKPKSAR